jgi:exoribonuclease R
MGHRITIPESVTAHFGYSKPAEQDFSFVDVAAAQLPHEPERYLAIDPFNPHEIDDAILVRKDSAGGFIVKLAMPDGSLIPPELFDQAILKKKSSYRGDGGVRTLLPYDLSVGALSLRDMTKKPAVVATMKVDQRTGIELVDLSKRAVTARQTTYYRLENKALAMDPNAQNWSLLRAVNAYRESMQLPALQPGGARIMSHFIVEHFAVAFNLQLPLLAAEHNVPLIHRNYSGEAPNEITDLLAEESRGRSRRRAFFSTSGHGHAGFGGRPYARGTTPLAHADDMTNHQQIPALLSSGSSKAMFNKAELGAIAERLNA